LIELIKNNKIEEQAPTQEIYSGMGNVAAVHHSNMNAVGAHRSASANNSQHKATYEENVPPSARSGIQSIHGPNGKGVNRTGAIKMNIQNLN
jgi:hypothetical protein